MGIDYYRRPGVKGYIKDNEDGQLKILNSVKVEAALLDKGYEAIVLAKSIFAAHSRHESTPPTLYAQSFKLRRVRRGLARAVQVYNDDPTAEWVEFGAHAGGKTPVLKYRILGRTFDSLEIP